MAKKIFKSFAYLVFIILFTLLAAEIILRIHNPFYTTIRGNSIYLPVNKVMHIKDGVDFTINSMGFNGAEKPKDFDKDFTIMTVGGSTTRCFVLGDGKTWPSLLGEKLKMDFPSLWLNNAGLDGHSTFGHQLLINDFISKIKPKVVVFLIGINDVGRDDLNNGDKGNEIVNPHSFKAWLSKHSELENLIVNIRRNREAAKKNLDMGKLDFSKIDTLTLSEDEMAQQISRYKDLLAKYKERVQGLIKSCRENNMEPIFITQPLIAGSGIDSVTHANLEKIKITQNFIGLPDNKLNGLLYWRILELYNKQTLDAAREANCFSINLADEMPKNSYYFIDYCHYTNEGAAKVSGLIYSELEPYLKEHYKDYLKKDNN